jgi:hypothetical protein
VDTDLTIETTPAEQLALATLDLGPDGRRIVIDLFCGPPPAGLPAALHAFHHALAALARGGSTDAYDLSERAQEAADVLAIADPEGAWMLAGACRSQFMRIMRQELGEDHDRAASWLRAVRRTITRNEPTEETP